MPLVGYRRVVAKRAHIRLHWGTILLSGLGVLAAVAAGIALAASLARTTITVGPVTVVARVSVAWPGATSVLIPPFGEAHAHTHDGPVRFVLNVQKVDIPGVERLLRAPVRAAGSRALPGMQAADQAAATVSDVVTEETTRARRRLTSLVIVVTILSAAFAAAVAWGIRLRWRLIGVSAAVAAALVAGSAGLASATFDPAGLTEPRLEGALVYLPRLESIFTARLTRVEALREQAAEIAEQLAAYYADPRSIAAGGGLPGTYRVLHVSDMHLDPVGAELARSLARSYDASLVINTGDAGITGSAEEAALLPSLLITETPTLFVSGNHDAGPVLVSLGGLANISVLDGETVVDGLRVFGLPDPQGADPGIEPDRDAVEASVTAVAELLSAQRDAGLPLPDIIALHSPIAEKRFIGLAPIILSGHTHSERMYVNDGTVRLNSGTLGGMPYDPDRTDRARLPHSASILYYTSELPRRLIAVDRVSVTPEQTTSMTRQVVDETLLP